MVLVLVHLDDGDVARDLVAGLVRELLLRGDADEVLAGLEELLLAFGGELDLGHAEECAELGAVVFDGEGRVLVGVVDVQRGVSPGNRDVLQLDVALRDPALVGNSQHDQLRS